MISVVDKTVQGIGSNPYLVTIALVITISPALWVGTKLLWRLGGFVIGSIRNGVRSQIRRRFVKNLRINVRYDQHGIVVKKIESLDIYLLVSSAFISIFAVIAATSTAFLVTYATGSGSPAVTAAVVAGFSGFIYGLQIYLGVIDYYWLLKYSQRSLSRRKKTLEAEAKRLRAVRDQLKSGPEASEHVAEAVTS